MKTLTLPSKHGKKLTSVSLRDVKSNYGHAGRPGQVGGSGSGEGDEWETPMTTEQIKAYVTENSKLSDKLEGGKSWLNSEGKWINVDEHRDIMPIKYSPDGDLGWSATTSDMNEAGFARIEIDYQNRILYIESRTLTSRQKSEAQDTAIEKNLKFVHDRGAKTTCGNCHEQFPFDEQEPLPNTPEVSIDLVGPPLARCPSCLYILNRKGEVMAAFDGKKFNPDEARDENGKWHSGGPTSAKTKPPALSEKSRRAKAAHFMVDKDIQRYAEEHNEPKFAKAIGGVSFPDNEAIDIAVPGRNGVLKDGIELKTIVQNGNAEITMKGEAIARKKRWERKNKAAIHTVVLDDSKVFNANGPGKHDLSKRVMYYRRGFGSFRIHKMYRVKDMAEIKSLMDMPKRQLPEGAK